jgi:hypothetical protein
LNGCPHEAGPPWRQRSRQVEATRLNPIGGEREPAARSFSRWRGVEMIA